MTGLEPQHTERRHGQSWLTLCSRVIDALPVGILVWRLDDLSNDKSFRLIGTNPASSQATGFPMNSFVGQTMPEAFPALYETPLPALYLEAIHSGHPQELAEFIYGDSHISRATFSVKAIPLPDQCVLVVFENITHRRKLEDALDGALHALLQDRKKKNLD